jgi:hypothetical protein
MIKVSWHSEFDLHLQSFHPFETIIKIIFGFLKHVEFAEIVRNNAISCCGMQNLDFCFAFLVSS